MAVEDHNDAQAIASGINAWEILTGERARETLGFDNKRLEEQQSPTPTNARSLQNTIGVLDSSGTSVTKRIPNTKSRCPFGGLGDLSPGHEAFTDVHSSTPKRPDSLPTPPELREEFITDASRINRQPQSFASPPPSATGSASKCPIRYLDERSPEEIARYFETHKHEIPRSHEICVKHYQSNEESIRQLDAKYGSLVSMIQGLGVKHKPLLPAKEEGGDTAMERRSMEKVEEWAENVKTIPDNESVRSAGLRDGEDRKGHFDRPLEEIRVGESPSRPWGIRVPIEKEIASSASISLGGCSKRAPSPELAPAVDEEIAGLSIKAEVPYPSPPVSAALKSPPPPPKTDQPRMVFTGPVFIGYSADQAAELIKQCGTGVNIPGV